MEVEWEDVDPSSIIPRSRRILDLLKGGLALLLGKPASIAITGMQGVGKSVLFDYLTGKAFKPDYKLPLQSQRIEKGKVQAGERRIRFGIVPGQANATPRFEAIDEVFKTKRPVDGVIHVVSYGYATVRNPDVASGLIKELKVDTIPKLRTRQLQDEIEDLKETCLALREAHHKHRSPKWLIVAVDKVDLYYSQLVKVREYYSPTADNAFSETLRDLASQVGTDYFRWEVAPVCASLQRFEWHKQHLDPQVTEERRNAYLAQLMKLLESYCG